MANQDSVRRDNLTQPLFAVGQVGTDTQRSSSANLHPDYPFVKTRDNAPPAQLESGRLLTLAGDKFTMIEVEPAMDSHSIALLCCWPCSDANFFDVNASCHRVPMLHVSGPDFASVF